MSLRHYPSPDKDFLVRTTLPTSELSVRAVAAAVAIARAHGVRCTTPAVLTDRSNVLVHLRPAPVVARVATTTALVRPNARVWLAREIAVAQFLVARGAGVVPPSSEVPPGPHEADGFAVSFWRFVVHHPDHLPAAVEVGRSLAALHRVLRDFPDALPYLASPLDEVPRWLDALERAGALATSDLTLLRQVYERVAAVLRTPVGPVQALHGDAHTHNVLVTAEGLLWTDFEDTCCGPLAWDLACFARTAPWGAEAALASYGDAPSQEALQPYVEARFLQGTVWYAVLALRFPECQAQAKAALRRWHEHA